MSKQKVKHYIPDINKGQSLPCTQYPEFLLGLWYGCYFVFT